MREKEVPEALETLNQILAAGKESRRFLEDMLQYCRDLLIYQQAPNLVEEQSSTIRSTFTELAQTVSADQLFSMIKILSDTQNEIRLPIVPLFIWKSLQSNLHSYRLLLFLQQM